VTAETASFVNESYIKNYLKNYVDASALARGG